MAGLCGDCRSLPLLALACAWAAPLAAQGQQATVPGQPNLPQLQQLVVLPEAEQRAVATQQQLTDWFLYRVRAYQQTLEGDAIAPLVNLGNYDAYRARMARNGGDPSWYVVFRNRNGGGPTKDPGEPFVFPNDGQLNNILSHDAGDTATCWHELQHGVLSARNLSTRGFYGADQEHVYLETYAQPTVAWLRDLNRSKRFERLVREANDRAAEHSRRGVSITASIERDIWGGAAQAWRSALKGTARIALLDESLRQEYFDVAGVRVPTVAEVIAFYRDGTMRAANGDAIRVPVWVLCRDLCLEIVSIERQRVSQPPVVPGQLRQAFAFRLLTMRENAGGVTRSYPVERGRLRVTLVGDDDQALITLSSGSEHFAGIPVPGGSSSSLFDLDLGSVRERVGESPAFEVQLVRAHPELLAQTRTYRIEAEYSDPGTPTVYDTTTAVFLVDLTPPSTLSLSIEGPRETTVGQPVTLTAIAAPRDPATRATLAGTNVEWLLGGRVVHSGGSFSPDVAREGEQRVTARLVRPSAVLATSGTHTLRVVAPATALADAGPPAGPAGSAQPLYVPRKGAWVLQSAKDTTRPGLDQIERYANDPSGRRYQNAVAISVASATTSCTLEYRDRAAGTSRSEQRRSTGSWTEPAVMIPAETPISVSVRSECQSPSPRECATNFFWGGSGNVVSVEGSDTASTSYTLPTGVEGMWRQLTASHLGPGGGSSREFHYLWQDAAVAPAPRQSSLPQGGPTMKPPAPRVGAAEEGPAAPVATSALAAERLRREGQASQSAGRLAEAVARYRESLALEPNPGLEAYVATLEEQLAAQERAREAAGARQEQERKAGMQLYKDGLELLYAGKLTEALAKYRQSLALAREPWLEQETHDLEAEIARRAREQANAEAAAKAEAAERAAEARAEAARRAEAEAQAPRESPPAESGAAVPATPSGAPSAPSTAQAAVDPRQREKAQRLRGEGEKEEAKQKLKKAIEKYGESLELLPDPALEQHVRDLEPLAEQQERERKAKQARDQGRGFEVLNLPGEAARKYRDSISYVPDPELEEKARQLEARAATQEREQQQAEQQSSVPPSSPSPPSRTTPPVPSSPPAPARTGGAATCSVTGEWVAEGGGATYFLQQEGGRVTGRKEAPFGETIVKEDVSGTFSGNSLRLAWSTRVIGTFIDNALQGTMSGNCASMQFEIRATWRSDGSGSSFAYGVNRRR